MSSCTTDPPDVTIGEALVSLQPCLPDSESRSLADVVADRVCARMEQFMRDVVLAPLFAKQSAALEASFADILEQSLASSVYFSRKFGLGGWAGTRTPQTSPLNWGGIPRPPPPLCRPLGLPI